MPKKELEIGCLAEVIKAGADKQHLVGAITRLIDTRLMTSEKCGLVKTYWKTELTSPKSGKHYWGTRDELRRVDNDGDNASTWDNVVVWKPETIEGKENVESANRNPRRSIPNKPVTTE